MKIKADDLQHRLIWVKLVQMKNKVPLICLLFIAISSIGIRQN